MPCTTPLPTPQRTEALEAQPDYARDADTARAAPAASASGGADAGERVAAAEKSALDANAARIVAEQAATTARDVGAARGAKGTVIEGLAMPHDECTIV